MSSGLGKISAAQDSKGLDGACGEKSNASAESNPEEGTNSPLKDKQSRLSLSPTKSDEFPVISTFTQIFETEVIGMNSFEDVMKVIGRRHYNIANEVDANTEIKCKIYFEKDYVCEIVTNHSCVNYPSKIIVPYALKENDEKKEGSDVKFNKDLYSERVTKMHYARLRSRYVVPVMLFDNKFICRSGTLSCKLAAAYQQSVQPQALNSSSEGSIIWSILTAPIYFGKRLVDALKTLLDWDAMTPLFKEDADILMDLNMGRVCDLMVEFAKEALDGYLIVSLSEIKYQDIYRKFKVEDMPFPGCEFFKLYKEANRNPEGLKFDWSEPSVTRGLHLNGDLSNLIPDLDVDKMEEWDLVELTRNYLKIILAYLVKDKFGILIHCISGWDRTPLFISLVRLSLWADQVIHPSLDYCEIAYLTVAYDWYLFGHVLPDRLRKGEDIMHFCFNFLSYIADDEFSITKMFTRLPAEERIGREFPEYKSGRSGRLNDVRSVVLGAYNEYIIHQIQDTDEPAS